MGFFDLLEEAKRKLTSTTTIPDVNTQEWDSSKKNAFIQSFRQQNPNASNYDLVRALSAAQSSTNPREAVSNVSNATFKPDYSLEFGPESTGETLLDYKGPSTITPKAPTPTPVVTPPIPTQPSASSPSSVGVSAPKKEVPQAIKDIIDAPGLTDQQRREQLEKALSSNQGGETFALGLGGLADAFAQAGNAQFGSSNKMGTMESITKGLKESKEEAKVSLEQRITNDPTSQTSKSAQDEFIRLAGIKNPADVAKVRKLNAKILAEKLPVLEKAIEAQLKRETLELQEKLKMAEIKAAKELKEMELSGAPLKSAREELAKMTPEYTVAAKSADSIISGKNEYKFHDSDRIADQTNLENLYSYYNKYVLGGRVNEALDKKMQKYRDSIHSTINPWKKDDVIEFAKAIKGKIDEHYQNQAKLAGTKISSSTMETTEKDMPTINTQEEYNKLPKGTRYKDSSGNEGVKK